MAVRALHTAASGMKAMQTHVDVLANNLANVQTIGFKRDRAEFSDLLYQEMRRPGVLTPLDNRTPTGIEMGTGVQVQTVAKEHEQGSLIQTHNPFDWAISGAGYYQIRIQGDQIAYTRNGTFKRDSTGQIVTPEGYLLEPAITLGDDIVAVQLGRDGRLTGYNNEGAPVGEFQIELAVFPNPQGLQPIGDNLFIADPDATGPIQVGNPGTTGFGIVHGGFLEASNVDVVKSMVDLIEAQRAYEFNSNAIKSSDQMLQQAANLVR